MIELDQDNLGEILNQNDKVIVQYGATWCGNCRMIKPKFKQLAEAHEDITFVYVDAEKYPDSRKFAEVNNLPTFAFFKSGEIVKQNQGNKIQTIKELVDEAASH